MNIGLLLRPVPTVSSGISVPAQNMAERSNATYGKMSWTGHYRKLRAQVPHGISGPENTSLSAHLPDPRDTDISVPDGEGCGG